MYKAAFIFLIILILKIQTMACEWQSISSNFMTELNQKNSGYICQTVSTQSSKKTAIISCLNKQNLSVSYENYKIHLLTQTQTKFPYLSQCWIEGTVDSNCKVHLQDQKCQVWDLRIN